MQRITKERSGYHIIWALADALKWRCSEFDPADYCGRCAANTEAA